MLTLSSLAARRAAYLLACMAAGAVLEGCAEKVAQGPRSRVFAADVSGRAKNCTVSKVDVRDGQETPATVQVGNDGGWCAITVDRRGKPYDSGLLITRPAHGTVVIHPVGDDTRIDYTPARGYTGSDSFAVRLIPGDGSIRASVTVTAPGAPAASPRA